MFPNHLKTAFRSLWRKKSFTVINMLGASVQSIVLLFSRKFTILIAVAFVIVALLAVPGTAQSVTDNRLKGLDTLMGNMLRDWQVAGCAIAVVEKDKVVYAQGFGYRDYEKKLPVTPNTVFSIASCTKAFTGALVGIMATEYQLDINKPVNHYFPELVFNNDLLTNHVTVKDMLTHRTGLPRHDWLTFSRYPIPLDSIVYRIRYLQPSAGFREKLQYCNLMYTVLGALVKKVTARPWETYMQEKVLQPLEMRHTSCLISDLTASPEFSWGYRVRNDSFVRGTPETSGANAAGSMNASVADMAKWLTALINDGKYKGKQVLPSRFLQEATSPQMSAPSRPRPGSVAYPDCYFGDYGYGWNIASYRGHYMAVHGGDLPLYSSYTSLFPTDSIGIVVLVNKFNAAFAETVTSHIADKLLQLPYKDWNSAILALQKKNSPPAPQPAVRSAPLSHPPQDYSGTYVHPAYGTIEVFCKNDSLYAVHNQQPIFFRHYSHDIFRAGVPGGRLQFMMNREGVLNAITAAMEPAVADIVFIKK